MLACLSYAADRERQQLGAIKGVVQVLFDLKNLSPRLVQRLSELYPGSAHVYGLGLDCLRHSTLEFCARERIILSPKMRISAN